MLTKLLLAAACVLPAAAAQTESQVTITRKDTTIVVTLKAQYANGARFIGNNPNCAPGIRQTLLYGPAPGYVDTKVGDDTELRSNVAIVRSPEANGAGAGAAGPGAAAAGSNAGGSGPASANAAGSDASGAPPAGPANGAPPTPSSGGAEPAGPAPHQATGSTSNASEQETLELFDGTVTIDRPGCIESADRAATPSVTLVQGRTTVKGTHFFLDQGTDTASMDGPVELDRVASGDSPALQATADSMTFDTQTRHTTLSGNVRVTSEDRVTTAGTLELDEKAGVAMLTGSPARSAKGQNVLQGSRMRYYLNSNDVVVLGNVQGQLEISSP